MCICFILIITIILVLLNNEHINMDIFNIKKNNNKNSNIIENFKCLNNKYKKCNGLVTGKLLKKPHYVDGVYYDIKVPLRAKYTRQTDNLGWKGFFKNNFDNNLIDHKDNFEGTNFRNYLDNLIFFKN